MQPPPAPLIGVLADHKHLRPAHGAGRARTFVGAYDSYLHCLALAGALPVVVPLKLSPVALRGLFDRLDGILLAGGGDVDPVFYGEKPLNDTVREINPLRDSAEIRVARWAAAEDVPLLGICRGHQVTNVALGGDLVMDIPTQLPEALRHTTPADLPLNHPAHPVAIAPGTRLAAILQTDSVITNSRHHQAVRHLGDGLVAAAHSPDGIVEALEKPEARFFLTVQWHPENLCRASSETTDMTPLFRAFVEAAASFQQDRHYPVRSG